MTLIISFAVTSDLGTPSPIMYIAAKFFHASVDPMNYEAKYYYLVKSKSN